MDPLDPIFPFSRAHELRLIEIEAFQPRARSKENEVHCSYCASIAGGLAGAGGILIGQPFDTLKVRMQIAKSGGPPPRHGGFIAMYRGIVPPMVTSSTVASLCFLGFDTVYHILHHQPGPAPLWVHFWAGSLGVLPASFITCPSMMVKERVGTIECLRRLTRQRGVLGLYRFYGLHASLEAFGRGWYMLTYEWTKRLLATEPITHGRRSDDLPLYRRTLAGASAGVVGWLSIYPLDVIRSRLMSQSPHGDQRFQGAMDCVRQTVRECGVRGLFRGLSVTLLRAGPVAGFILPAYDLIYSYIAKL